MYMHYKGATKTIKEARYRMRQADRILRTHYHGANDHRLLDAAIVHTMIALARLKDEERSVEQQLRMLEGRDQ